MTLGRWTARVVAFRSDTYALYLALRDPRVGWPVKIVLLGVIAYVLSPVDLIPDWIPGLGYLDDAIMIPLGVALVTRLIPREIMAEHRATAVRKFPAGRPPFWRALVIVGLIWLAGTALFVFILIQIFSKLRS